MWHGHVFKYEAVFGYFEDIWIVVTKWGINYATIINRINYLLENVLCSKKW